MAIHPQPAAFTLTAVFIAALHLSAGTQQPWVYALSLLGIASVVISAWCAARSLQGVELEVLSPAQQVVQAGQVAQLTVRLTLRRSRSRTHVLLRAGEDLLEARLRSGEPVTLSLALPTARRGRYVWPPLCVESNVFASVWQMQHRRSGASEVLAFPSPEQAAPVMPGAASPAQDRLDQPTLARHRSIPDGAAIDGVRLYERGDPRSRIAWRAMARLGSGHLLTRQAASSAQAPESLWLDEAHTGLPPGDARLSRLSAWVQAAHEQGRAYGLRVGAVVVAPGVGADHRLRCLRALALAPGLAEGRVSAP